MGLLRDIYRRFLLARHCPRHWQLRPNTLDARLFRHVVIENEYRLPARLPPGAVVVDIGAHTGSFALAALRRGAGRVVCCEPQRDNGDLLVANVAPYPEIDVHRVAVWSRSGTVFINNPLDQRNTGAAQVSEIGEAVAAVTLDEMVRPFERIHLLKLDCEGAEWPILAEARCWDKIDAVCGEYHLPPLICAPSEGPAPSAERLVELLETCGFSVELASAPGSRLPVGLFFATKCMGLKRSRQSATEDCPRIEHPPQMTRNTI